MSIKFVQADSENLKNNIYKLRYKIYVEEFGFEKSEDHPDGYEKDEYDENSIHFAALDENGKVIGTIRLILNSEKGFPIEHAAEITFIGEKPSPDKIAEISRLAVSKNFQRYNSNCSIKNKLLTKNTVIFGLYKLMYHESKRRGITHWYIIIEKKLFRQLKRYGFIFHQIGKPVQYHGTRIPYLGIILDIENLMKKKPEILKMLLVGLEKKYHPKKTDN